MPKMKGSRTEHNLMAAFAGESQARNRYTFYAGIVASWYLDTATGATVVLAAAACFAVTALLRAARPRE